jgi:AcrR family transcriptional regulator
VHLTPSRDRRVRRTRALLLEAFSSLVHEKPYEDIVVKEILQRADVGRSTFYAHFHDKEQLLTSALGEVLRAPSVEGGSPSLRFPERVLRFSLPVLEHVARHGATSGLPAIAQHNEQARFALHTRLERAIAHFVAGELRQGGREHGTSARIPVELLAAHVAATFALVLEWWATSRRPPAPLEGDALFRTLVLPVLARAFE